MLRDDVERTLRAWDKDERDRGAPPIIDFDFHPNHEPVVAADNRLAVFETLDRLRRSAAAVEDIGLSRRLDADLAYLRALMGEHAPLDDYVYATQGCHAACWPDEYITAVGERARAQLEEHGIAWGPRTQDELDESEIPIDPEAAAGEIRQAAEDLEPVVRQATGATAAYELTIESVHVDAYWGYWLDGAGRDVRLRLNLRNARFTKVMARQFALHEVLGHGLQCASLADRCAHEDVPWVRLMSVHTASQVQSEGLAQALPLFVLPDDKQLATRVRLAHYTQLVRAELHVAVNSGMTVRQCADHARDRVPFWKDGDIADALTDRGANPLLRSYLWAYPAGIDWFIALADANTPAARSVLHAAYREPLTPDDLRALWPESPTIGGSTM